MIGWVIALTSEETLPWVFIAPRLRPRGLTPAHRNSKSLGITAIYNVPQFLQVVGYYRNIQCTTISPSRWVLPQYTMYHNFSKSLGITAIYHATTISLKYF